MSLSARASQMKSHSHIFLWTIISLGSVPSGSHVGRRRSPHARSEGDCKLVNVHTWLLSMGQIVAHAGVGR